MDWYDNLVVMYVTSNELKMIFCMFTFIILSPNEMCTLGMSIINFLLSFVGRGNHVLLDN